MRRAADPDPPTVSPADAVDPDRTTVNPADAVDPDRTTVNQAISLDPERVEPLARLGIDTCCGGSLTLRVAAERHGVDLAVLLDAIGAASEDGCAPEGGSCACSRPVEER